MLWSFQIGTPVNPVDADLPELPSSCEFSSLNDSTYAAVQMCVALNPASDLAHTFDVVDQSSSYSSSGRVISMDEEEEIAPYS